MAKNCCSIVFTILLILLFVLSCFGNNMGPDCSSLSNIQIHYKNYYDVYLGDNPFVAGVNKNGLFVKMITEASDLCCSTAQLTFHAIQQLGVDDKEIEELVLDSVKADRNNPDNGVIKLFSPEFAFKKLLQVYDSQTPFIRFSRSPGPALIMISPEPKEPVFVGEIILKSWTIIIFLITFAWVIGIFAWIADHHVNPKEFPSPFYIGMIEGFWWSVVTMTTLGYGDKTPKGPVARSLAVIWIMISTVFLSLFTANASSILAISQAEEDHTNTLGTKIACFNSKHFWDVELNLGAQNLGFSNVLSCIMANKNGIVDRLIFPNYLDFLYLRTLPEYSATRDGYVLTNTLDHPFQIGMAYAVDARNMTSVQASFLRCLRAELPSIEKRLRREEFDLSKITGGADIQDEIKVPLDSDSLLTLTYWFFAMIVCLIALGLTWDFWVYWKRIRPLRHHSSKQDDVEMADMNGEVHTEGHDEDVLSNKSGSPPNMEHWAAVDRHNCMTSISGSLVPPPPPPPGAR